MKVWKFDRILLTVISNQNSQFQGSNKTVFCYCLCYIMIYSSWIFSGATKRWTAHPPPLKNSRWSYRILNTFVPAWLSPLISHFSHTLLQLSMGMNVDESNTVLTLLISLYLTALRAWTLCCAYYIRNIIFM